MKIYICFLILAGLAFGCKKSEFVLDYSGIKPVFIIPNGNWPSKSPYEPQPTDSLFGVQQLKLYARLSYATALDKPVKVVFKEDPTQLNSYNAKWGTNYKALPEAAYRATTLELNIPAGVHQAFIPVQLFPTQFNGTDDYLIAYTISSAEDQIIGANAKTIVFTIKGK